MRGDAGACRGQSGRCRGPDGGRCLTQLRVVGELLSLTGRPCQGKVTGINIWPPSNHLVKSSCRSCYSRYLVLVSLIGSVFAEDPRSASIQRGPNRSPCFPRRPDRDALHPLPCGR
ncbi:hypothetical protein FA95DRAFT_645506 [Auriscalpium vulgare]|uniref:Uncharacterized protein n=1 Tax=Auriscalpium vulgare TaxID=40419 RepID=A0ACB8S3B5_9AGAM|nr:hypothetical protein FA95DRAFT_645506 [Auriscalpium vulgare]